jgi:hypothetical protein
VGRFLSVDPVSASSINGGNFNRYWYANNNPYKFVDPDGRIAAMPGTCQRLNVCLGKSGGSSRAEADQQREYEGAQADPSKRGAFVSRMHQRNGLTGAKPVYDANEKDLGSYDELDGTKRIGPGAFKFASAADLGSVLVHEGNHEMMAKAIPDYTQLKHTNARKVIEHNAHSAELSANNPFLHRLSQAYLDHTKSELSTNYSEASPQNRQIIDSGLTCATAFCSGD